MLAQNNSEGPNRVAEFGIVGIPFGPSIFDHLVKLFSIRISGRRLAHCLLDANHLQRKPRMRLEAIEERVLILPVDVLLMVKTVVGRDEFLVVLEHFGLEVGRFLIASNNDILTCCYECLCHLNILRHGHVWTFLAAGSSRHICHGRADQVDYANTVVDFNAMFYFVANIRCFYLLWMDTLGLDCTSRPGSEARKIKKTRARSWWHWMSIGMHWILAGLHVFY